MPPQCAVHWRTKRGESVGDDIATTTALSPRNSDNAGVGSAVATACSAKRVRAPMLAAPPPPQCAAPKDVRVQVLSAPPVGGELINFLKKKISKKIFLSGDFIDMRMLSNCHSVLFRKKSHSPYIMLPLAKKTFSGHFY